MYFHDAETLERSALEKLQAERLKKTIELAANSPYYSEVFKNNKIDPSIIETVDDVKKLPFTTKEDLRSQYPYGLLTQSLDNFVRLHASSGTTGTPTAVFYTQKDLDTWADLMARSMYAVGLRKSDVLQNMSGYGLFTGGLGIHYGSERLGCLTVPAGAGNTKRQIKLIRDFNVTALHIIPSFALYFAAKVRAEGFDPADMPWKIALIGAEPHTEHARKKIEEMLHIKAYNSYGLSEMNGPGVAFECTQQSGMHIWEDSFIAEIIDPETGDPVEDGEIGELVMTTITREGMPIIRYRTRDLTRFIPGQCKCGRTSRRIDRIMGRADDMLILKGVNIYPMQIEKIIMGIPEVGQNYVIELIKEGLVDQIRVKVEIKEEFFVEDMRALQGLQKMIAGKLRDEILVTPRVELVQHNSIPKSEGKAKRVIDLRETED
ncbi:phenylacetate--CoA ligase family protein [Maridesulfovibrio hydrothermalis]|uniref:Phenylacetate-coenzyme A ligase n=1 Tax=Maridesulfovibrio hydrothermalis AM13 = DSM 14728 TaxID=1121451 RepID=L0RCL4_9BACT|nr:phenylacetate--CoA ligase [Maridesulfovibrio hydrothermalis]CCO24489.1 Phenylacetate-coenzyme A ligase [Maridesulfovibrio hydrothermalis AM13 = DSM 14728]